ncbi:uncharacterized protein LOC144590617 isoform X1 [Rhinoraja longicauda]
MTRTLRLSGCREGGTCGGLMGTQLSTPRPSQPRLSLALSTASPSWGYILGYRRTAQDERVLRQESQGAAIGFDTVLPQETRYFSTYDGFPFRETHRKPKISSVKMH